MTRDDEWRRIRERLHELRLLAGRPTLARIGKATGLHQVTVGHALRGYSSKSPGWDSLAAIWVYLGGDLAELTALHPRPQTTPPAHIASEASLACPHCHGVLKLTVAGGRRDRAMSRRHHEEEPRR